MDVTYPVVKLSRITRVQTMNDDKSEYALRSYRIIGLTREGTTIRYSLNECDYWLKPTVTFKFVNIDPKASRNDPTAKKVQVATIPYNKYGVPNIGRAAFLEPWSVEKITEWLKDVQGPFDGSVKKGCNLNAHRYSDNRSITVRSVDDFLLPFDEMFETTIRKAIAKQQAKSPELEPKQMQYA
jgi:hypothetical protein